MANFYDREEKFRGKDMKILQKINLTICGVGALGSNLLGNYLLRMGVGVHGNITVIDFDRVNVDNTSTQLWIENDAGLFKTEAMGIWAENIAGVQLNEVRKKIQPKDLKRYLSNKSLVVECFDAGEKGDALNPKKMISDYCKQHDIQCVHAGLSPEGYGHVMWEKHYVAPETTIGKNDPCENPMSRLIIMGTVLQLSRAIIDYHVQGICSDWEMTERDLNGRCIRRYNA